MLIIFYHFIYIVIICFLSVHWKMAFFEIVNMLFVGISTAICCTLVQNLCQDEKSGEFEKYIYIIE